MEPPLHAWEDRGVEWLDMLHLLILMNLKCPFKASKVLQLTKSHYHQQTDYDSHVQPSIVEG